MIDDHAPAFDPCRDILQRIDGERAGRFQHDPLVVQHLEDRGADPVLLDRQHVAQRHVFQRGEVARSDPRDRGAIHEGIDLIKCHRLTCHKRGLEAGPTRGFGQNHARLRGFFAEIEPHSRGKAPAAHRQDKKIRRLPKLIQNLKRDRGLALDHIRVVERGKEMRTLPGGIVLGRLQGIVEVVAGQADLDSLLAKHPGLLDLLLGGRDRHEDHAPHPEMPAGKGHALGVVPGTRANKGPRPARNRLAHRVESAPDLVGPHRAQILALQPDLGAVALGQEVVLQKRGRVEERAHLARGGFSGVGKSSHACPRGPFWAHCPVSTGVDPC